MKEYHIGLDIGTSSIGWAVTDSQFKLMRIKGKTAIGVRLFEEREDGCRTPNLPDNAAAVEAAKMALALLR
ncbi:hypothetical protein ACW180_03165 [Limosilactobacillus fermentum]